MDWVQAAEKQNYFTIFTIGSVPEINATQSGIELRFFVQKNYNVQAHTQYFYDMIVWFLQRHW